MCESSDFSRLSPSSFFFFKQKTAYDMRISDWSSDVCSSDLPVQGLAAGEVLTESFAYAITDGDGDISAATLTITINGSDDGVTVNGLAAVGAELIVDEDNLADGSSPDAAALTQDGSFSVSAPDGLANVSVGGVPVVTNGVFTPGAVASPLGTVNITRSAEHTSE